MLPPDPKELWKHHGGGPGLCWGMYFVQPPSCGVDFALFFLCSLLLCPKTIFLPPAAAATPGPVSASSHSLPLLATLPLSHGKCHCGGFGPCARWLLAPGRCRPHQSCSRRDPAAPLCPGVGPEAIPLFPTGAERLYLPCLTALWGQCDVVFGTACHCPGDSVPPPQGQAGTALGTARPHPKDGTTRTGRPCSPRG